MIHKTPKNTPDITIKEQHETTKILRIMFNEDLKYTKQRNWGHILQKMENQINKLSPRLKKMLNKSGPRIEPCGTPNIISSQELYDEFILVLCFL